MVLHNEPLTFLTVVVQILVLLFSDLYLCCFYFLYTENGNTHKFTSYMMRQRSCGHTEKVLVAIKS
jgi:hypothetical protein